MSYGQHLILGVPGLELDSETAKLFKEVQPGGFILFGRNIDSPKQLRKLCEDLIDVVDERPIMCIDQEGGRVARLREIGSEPPSAKELVDKGNLDLISEHGVLTAEILRLFLFNLDLCPVLDISHNGDLDNSLKNRCWGLTPEQTIDNSRLFNTTLREGGISSCGKHFPGYSKAQIDPHHELPLIKESRENLENWEWKPFKAMLGEIDSMMIGHAHYPALQGNEKVPSSLSEKIVKEILQNEWGFKGLTMTDDIDMGAILNNHSLEETMKLALSAGNQSILLCHRVQMAKEALPALKEFHQANPTAADLALEKIAEFRAKIPEDIDFTESRFQEIDQKIQNLRIEAVGKEKALQKTPEDANRSPVEDF